VGKTGWNIELPRLIGIECNADPLAESWGAVTYIDGHITNSGNKTVTGISIQVLFRNAANEVAQNETQAVKWIRTRDPYVDLEPVSAAPLKPGEGRDFRLIFDAVTEGWNGVYPELRIVRVDAK